MSDATSAAIRRPALDDVLSCHELVVDEKNNEIARVVDGHTVLPHSANNHRITRRHRSTSQTNFSVCLDCRHFVNEGAVDVPRDYLVVVVVVVVVGLRDEWLDTTRLQPWLAGHAAQ
uniref:Uncharacterized protein n=1 Tax=Plectus sambesii TaxID=2011161 RepID=A0A914V380_9BILA